MIGICLFACFIFPFTNTSNGQYIRTEDPSLFVNYRPMYNRLVEFVEINEIPYLRPFGFRKNHSTLHALVDKSVVFCHWLVHYIKTFRLTLKPSSVVKTA